ncbi:MAG: PAS domain S-box protein [Oxalobacteraceae bacterium]|nr:MAG: PAS domain S-box protein [Oxalobacteraceae bacterium]
MHAEGYGTALPLIGGGEMGQLVRDTDWSATPLGDYTTWPQSLRSSLSMVLNTAGIAALYWGPEQWLLYNDAYGIALGDRHPHAFGKPMPEVLTDIGPVLGPQVADVLATGRGFAIENLSMVMRRFGRDEETTWTYGFSPVQGEDGGFAGVLLLATEVTAQKKAERELQASQARLQAMMDQAAAGIAQTMLDGQFTFVNNRFCSMLGRSREELLSLRMHDLTHPDDLSRNAAHLRHLAEGGPPFDVEKRYLCKDGSAVWVHNSVTGVREANDEVQSLLAVSIDITKQVAAETELRAREGQLRQLADALPVLVAFINRDLTYEFVNAAYRDWFGIEPEDTVGKSVAEVVGTQGYAERRSAIERALSGLKLLRTAAGQGEESAVLDPLLETCDSVMTYRRRHFSRPRLEPVIDLIFFDRTNPRSVAYQVDIIGKEIPCFPGEQEFGLLPRIREHMQELENRFSNSSAPNAEGFEEIVDSIELFADMLTQHYFSHSVRRVY